MGYVVIDMSMSLDGYIAAPNDTDGVVHVTYRVVRQVSRGVSGP